MAQQGLRQRSLPAVATESIRMNGAGKNTPVAVPAGSQGSRGGPVELLRMILLLTYFVISSCMINATQFLGAPLYIINRNYYYALMRWTKQCFGLLITTLCQWWSPTMIRLYSDWLYLWWIAYTNHTHGHLFIILKESLKWIPVLGPGMMFFEFIFLARNWATDKPRLVRDLSKLKSRHSGPLSGSGSLDPMWLMVFPEGTNLSDNGRVASARWAEKQGFPDLKHQLHPRSTGLLCCLQELKGTVDWVYDCTVAYEGIPPGEYGQDIFTLRTSFIEGMPPKSVNMYWRRFRVSSIPLDDAKDFERWLHDRWVEKDRLLERYMQTGCFPPIAEADDPLELAGVEQKSPVDRPGARYIETAVQQASRWEFCQIFLGPMAVGMALLAYCKLAGLRSLVQEASDRFF
ncbi:MAG: hypothetical protein M1826_007621 [Phylliscum demangeonii]|nr:MAG: hypothetical protein M1826_007621 [Phylliscum demangeonii]